MFALFGIFFFLPANPIVQIILAPNKTLSRQPWKHDMKFIKRSFWWKQGSYAGFYVNKKQFLWVGRRFASAKQISCQILVLFPSAKV